MNGTIIGGWEYVWAAYAVTWTALAVYAGSLLWRAKKANEKPEPKP